MRRVVTVVALAVGLLTGACTTNGRPTLAPSPTGSSTSALPTASSSSSTATTTPPRTTPIPLPSSSALPPPPALQAWFGRQWDRLPTQRRLVALTFDAGGDAAGVPSILAALRRADVPATFFLTGNWVQHYPSQAREIAAVGRIGDHSQTHPHFTGLDAAHIRAEVLGSARVIQQGCGTDPAPLFRFPYGDRDQRTIDAVNALGYLPVGWTVDTLGWKGTKAGITVGTITSRVLAAAQPGAIVLMHVGANPDDGSTLDADALPDVIAQLRARGYGFVSLTVLLTMRP